MDIRDKGKKKYFFIGIGGSGMSAIAQALACRGFLVGGSDRSLDRGNNKELFDQLRGQGISLHPQDGSGVTADCDFVVVSTAIENTVPDMARALELGVPVMHRSDLLAEIFNAGRGVAIGGTSGKSTVTGMTGVLLDFAGLDPTIINGGKMKDYSTRGMPGNARIGASDLVIIESDESDGSIVKYNPYISVVTNVTKDHKTIEELMELFGNFVAVTSGTAIINADCPLAASLSGKALNVLTYGISNSADVKGEDCVTRTFSSSFTLDGTRIELKLPGMHNISNALSAAAVGRALGLSVSTIKQGLETFTGIRRRFDFIGEAAGVKVIDDFGHNPDKIRATISTLHTSPGRLLLIFQPHGFGPTRFMFDELVETFSNEMSPADRLYMPEIFYAGGTAARSVSSAEIAEAIVKNGRTAESFETRAEIIAPITAESRPGDVIAVMGARDDTLTVFCQEILQALKMKR